MSADRNRNISPAQLCKDVDADGVRELLNTIGDKWSVFLIVSLKTADDQRARFSELERAVPGISQKMLSSTLKKLEYDGIVLREQFLEIPPRVEYELTPLGESLFDLMQGLVDWVSTNWDQVKAARAANRRQ